MTCFARIRKISSVFAALGAAFGLSAAQAQPPKSFSVLYAFNYSDGNAPSARVTLASNGALATSTNWGGPDNNGAAVWLSPPVPPATLWSETVLYSYPYARAGFGSAFASAPVFGGSGELFGASAQGADYAGGIYRLTPTATGWKPSALFNFRPTVPANGEGPSGDPVFGTDGALYGVTTAGGGGVCVGGGGCGVVYRLARPEAPGTGWTQSVIYNFPGGVGGAMPTGSLAFDDSGALYGVTQAGGAHGWGTVFKLTPPAAPATQWTAQTLYSFQGLTDGCLPSGGVLVGTDGALYGVGSCGAVPVVKGTGNGAGVVYRLAPRTPGAAVWNLTTLHAFSGGADGGFPNGGLAFGPGGALYGTTSAGGDTRYCGVTNSAPGCGVVYMLAPPASAAGAWSETVLYSFGGLDAGAPLAGVTVGPGGELYGSASIGGNGAGVIYRLQ